MKVSDINIVICDNKLVVFIKIISATINKTVKIKKHLFFFSLSEVAIYFAQKNEASIIAKNNIKALYPEVRRKNATLANSKNIHLILDGEK